MTYNHRKQRNNHDSNPEPRNATVRAVEAKMKKINLRPRHVVIGNTGKSLSSEYAIENVEARQTDEVENSGENNTVISGGVASGNMR